MTGRPILAVTLGDVAGVGPDILLDCWPRLAEASGCQPLAVGSAELLRRRARGLGRGPIEVRTVADPAAADGDAVVWCHEIDTADVAGVPAGQVDARAGRAAYDWLIAAADLALAGRVAGICTLPLHKEGLRAAGVAHPGHTEILAERCGVDDFAMMLYRQGLGVVHVTLHVALRDVFALLTTDAVLGKIGLADRMMRRLGVAAPRVGVASLNPHGSDGGLFGDEEDRIIRPAVERAVAAGIDAGGPLPTDTLFSRAKGGAYDAVVAMHHDQGHIALKTLGWQEAVNVTCGLPIVRTSVAHGTAYDIAGKGVADGASLLEAAAVAGRLIRSA